mmetsp:Transcript_18684/g.33805  ORF Transcript_18684/g.33805 Transcript_18684/m.33805 type:complete len:466 (+) Transcript_18684:351-1748(+)|eukprot:CAMPEP_0204901488 /NCGR_PEP_ID=MMETSP1397-20131031/3109_1 /ASSEMBLY_ACC=CAM_ASM_000891 /TAXON_ID=49980 /ORGANISM="Climacostomum Climacostomum virens, Strain Stock W-24" /LENGTH=465 /DNA_ID=CAMNT_0052069853 /DNA_START=343 /DNA_END=1740 /DNA_ORIENTATION=+
MGIKQLMHLLNEKAATSVDKLPLEAFAGQVIACDASMAIYQFILALMQQNKQGLGVLTNESGRVTAHLVGLLSRNIQFLQAGIKPIWVFDGKPPEMKEVALSKRRENKNKAKEALSEAQEAVMPDLPHSQIPHSQVVNSVPRKRLKTEEVDEDENAWSLAIKRQAIMKKKYSETVVEIEQNFKTRLERIVGGPIPAISSPDYCCHGESDMEAGGDFAEISDIINSLERRGFEDMQSVHKQAMKSIHISKSMFDDAKKLITLLGLPVINAPAEAEAQCAALVKAGIASAVASEDMDALTFGAEVLLRGFNSKKEPIVRIQLSKAMELLSLTYEEFVDLCILMGCDYTSTIEGVGPATAIKLINQCSRLEAVLDYVKTQPRFKIPEDFEYIGARQLFFEAETIDPLTIRLRWAQADTSGLYEFLVTHRGFSPNRVNGCIKRLLKTYKEPTQSKIDKFFASPKVKNEA